VDVRVIAATNKNLKEAIDKGAFREDLFYRLNGVTIELPPLRERRSDVGELARHFLHKCAREYGSPTPVGLAEATIELLGRYHWPGNVRELRNAVERGYAAADGSTQIQPRHLPAEITKSIAAKDEEAAATKVAMSDDALPGPSSADAPPRPWDSVCEEVKSGHPRKNPYENFADALHALVQRAASGNAQDQAHCRSLLRRLVQAAVRELPAAPQRRPEREVAILVALLGEWEKQPVWVGASKLNPAVWAACRDDSRVKRVVRSWGEMKASELRNRRARRTDSTEAHAAPSRLVAFQHLIQELDK
jgi:hypothetical protein